MTTGLRFAALLLFLSTGPFLGSCAHLDDGERHGRGPASAASCSKLTSDDQEKFARLVVAYPRINDALGRLNELNRAALGKVDTKSGVSPDISPDPSIDDFVSSTQIRFDDLDSLAKSTIARCAKIRRSGNLNEAAKLCGPDDSRLNRAERAHPAVIRDWSNESTRSIREWISVADKFYDPRTGGIMQPDVATELCASFNWNANAEDSIERVFVCLNSMVLNSAEYDPVKSDYVRGADGNFILKEYSTPLKGCLQAYLDGEVELAANGKPVPVPRAPLRQGRAAQPTPRSASLTPPAALGTPSTSDSSAGGSTIPAPVPFAPRQAAASRQTTIPYAPASPGASDHSSSNTSVNSAGSAWSGNSSCMPADHSYGSCRGDLCLWEFALKLRRTVPQPPATMTSDDAYSLLKEEGPKYAYEVSKHEALVLGQAYIVAALQQKWDSPKPFNDNLHQFTASCENPELRNDIQRVIDREAISEGSPGTGYSSEFADMRDIQESIGAQMVTAAQQIDGLTKLVVLLDEQLGDGKIDTGNPIAKIIPVFRYDAERMGISFDRHMKYQCNVFASMLNDPWPRTQALLTASDFKIRELLKDESFHKNTFCTGETCEYPAAFKIYLDETDPKSLPPANAPTPSTVRMRSWCQTRWDAARALEEVESSLVARLPALAYRETKPDGTQGPTLLEKIRDYRASKTNPRGLELNADFAAKEAASMLPKMQAGMRAYIGQLCKDLNEREMRSVYAAIFDGQLVSGFDYCVSLKDSLQAKYGASWQERGRDDLLRSGIACQDRKEFLKCGMTRAAKKWEAKQHIPEHLEKLTNMGMDMLFVYQLARATVRAYTLARAALAGAAKTVVKTAAQKALVGGMTGTLWMVGSQKLSKWLATNRLKDWRTYRMAAAATGMQGIDSYTNALEALAEPGGMKGEDFLIGFVIGAALSGSEPGLELGGFTSGPKPALATKSRFSKMFELQLVQKVREIVRVKDMQFKIKVAELRQWLKSSAETDPELPQKLIDSMAERLATMTNGEYAKFFGSGQYPMILARLMQTMEIRLRRVSGTLTTVLRELKSTLEQKKAAGEILSEAQETLLKTDFNPANLAKATGRLGPREAAILAREIELAARKLNGETPVSRYQRIGEFVEKLCGLASVCPMLRGLRGCPL